VLKGVSGRLSACEEELRTEFMPPDELRQLFNKNAAVSFPYLRKKRGSRPVPELETRTGVSVFRLV
jgi:hypothetical protein